MHTTHNHHRPRTTTSGRDFASSTSIHSALIGRLCTFSCALPSALYARSKGRDRVFLEATKRKEGVLLSLGIMKLRFSLVCVTRSERISPSQFSPPPFSLVIVVFRHLLSPLHLHRHTHKKPKSFFFSRLLYTEHTETMRISVFLAPSIYLGTRRFRKVLVCRGCCCCVW
jgi:hypothetical protein